jgi:(p)ppGpp synthase/HD superfamily hydrolase
MTMLTERFEQAFLYASHVHGGHKRKGTSIPYLSHLMGVASLVLEHGGTEDQAIAALLHDAAEDQGGQDRLDDIRARFGDAVADIVNDCTDSWEEPKPDWRERKEAYLKSLEFKPDASLLVSLADKTHNARAIVTDLHLEGAKLWERFKRPASDTLWYYGELVDVFKRRRPSPLTTELRRAFGEMQAFEDQRNKSQGGA